MISTRNLAGLPDPAALRRRFQSLAILDAILAPSKEDRAILFFDRWSIHDSVGAIRQGDDHLFAAIGPYGAFIKGFVKECPMGREGRNWPGMEKGVPLCYQEWVIHPYFEFEHTTFCIWRLLEEDAWRKSEMQPPLGEDPDGSEAMLRLLDGDPATFAAWAQSRYGTARRGAPVDVDAVGYLLDQGFVTESILRVLNPDLPFKSLAHDLRATGYPLREPL